MASSGARKRKKAKAHKHQMRVDTYGPENAKLIEDMIEIHARANLIRAKAYEVVDKESNPEKKEMLAAECCRAMWLRAGEKHFGYHPNRGDTIENWQIGC